LKDIALHILDILQNSIGAEADEINVEVVEDPKKNVFMFRITDNGHGMSAETLEKVTDAYYTSRTTRKVGLGLALLKQNTEAAGGRLNIDSEPGNGTILTATFAHDHVDRPPDGDLGGIMAITLCAHPEINFTFTYNTPLKSYALSTAEIKKELDDVPMTTPGVSKFVKEMMNENILNVKS